MEIRSELRVTFVINPLQDFGFTATNHNVVVVSFWWKSSKTVYVYRVGKAQVRALKYTFGIKLVDLSDKEWVAPSVIHGIC